MKHDMTKAAGDEGGSVEAARRKRASSPAFKKLCAMSNKWLCQEHAGTQATKQRLQNSLAWFVAI